MEPQNWVRLVMGRRHLSDIEICNNLCCSCYRSKEPGLKGPTECNVEPLLFDFYALLCDVDIVQRKITKQHVACTIEISIHCKVASGLDAPEML